MSGGKTQSRVMFSLQLHEVDASMGKSAFLFQPISDKACCEDPLLTFPVPEHNKVSQRIKYIYANISTNMYVFCRTFEHF